MLKQIIFAIFATLSGLAALYSLWGALNWRSQSMRQLPREEIDRALYDYHAWLFFLVLTGLVCGVFTFLLVWTSRSPKTNSDSPVA